MINYKTKTKLEENVVCEESSVDAMRRVGDSRKLEIEAGEGGGATAVYVVHLFDDVTY